MVCNGRLEHFCFFTEQRLVTDACKGDIILCAVMRTLGQIFLDRLREGIKLIELARNDKMILIGDKAQLPPIGEEESPALSPMILEGYGLKVYCCDLNEVLRQSTNSGILYNATMIRNMITHDEVTQLPKIRFDSFADIVMVPGDELIESLASS